MASSRRSNAPTRPQATAPAPSIRPWSEPEIERLQGLLDAVPAPFEPLDVSLLDGFLCGMLLQPQPIAPVDWLPFVTDADGRPLPAGFDAAPLHALTLRRRDELDAAIAGRRWFDPWIFELEADDPVDDADDDDEFAPIEAVYPWVAGFATALELFPGLMTLDPAATLEPLALVYRHLGADDLEDADELLAEIESLEPPADLGEAVEELVRATLLLADVSRPLAATGRSRR